MGTKVRARVAEVGLFFLPCGTPGIGLIAGHRALLNPPLDTEASLHYNESFGKRQRDNDALRPTEGGMFINGCLQTAARQNGGRPAHQTRSKKAQGVRQSMLRLLACIQESDRKKGREMLQFFTYNLINLAGFLVHMAGAL